jgi:hypothetical protein
MNGGFLMSELHKELKDELKRLHSAFINIGFIMEELNEQQDIDIEAMQCYPFEDSFENITANVADWMEEIMENLEQTN